MSESATTAATAAFPTSARVCAVPAPTAPVRPERMAPADARQLSKTFLLRLRALDEGTDEYQYVRNTLIEMNLSLVRYVARRFTRRGQPVDDILQVGTIGLIKAIDRWRPSRNVEFTTLAVPYIQGEIKRFFRDTTWAVRVPRRLQEMRIEIARAREQLEADGVQEPSAAQLAGCIGADEGEVAEGLVACNGYDSDSLDRPLQAGGPSERTGFITELLGSDDPALALAENVQALKPHLAKLNDRERTLLRLRYGAEMTQSEIGKELGLSQMHVSRLLARLCGSLREQLLAEA
ncbi:SigB/SigF/SigG family RNA polymerase sigma factor [Streptomyces lydicus]|uniref:SigB/SigF/SigG family RNA polymerase sigma factor n=1 Tax=Streptomyces lydicus TaxID=47763 RepID=UPI00286FD80D|nr:SigB/SigF/SigG family RNA polymerase sigma factor [Streptomyces lydicus]